MYIYPMFWVNKIETSSLLAIIRDCVGYSLFKVIVRTCSNNVPCGTYIRKIQRL
jgi:hypothetical protein